ncbi:MAG: DNA polymerase III subunit delta, partial [Spirochaetaceae bacterium]|nr:DNA polymerase III subunit delta [Spirochaetaceae bacterium]
MQGRAYIFLGPEIGEKEEALAELRSRLGGGEAPEESSWYAGEAPAALICDRIRNGSLFSARRLFLIKSAEGLKKDDAELLASCLEQLQDDTFVVLVSGETKIDARLERAVDPKNKRI